VGDGALDEDAAANVAAGGSDRLWNVVGAIGRSLAYGGAFVAAGGALFLLVVHRTGDERGGLVRVVQVATAQDVGRALNPAAVLGQVEGGIAQGVGLATMEEILLLDGKPRNPSFTDYLIPTALDMPEVVATYIEQPEPDAPFGAKGVGEPPVISSTPAVVAAIRAATGAALERVPVRPSDITGTG